MSNRWLASLIGLATLLWTVSASGQDIPPVSPETRAAAGELNDAQRAEVDGFLRACAQKMVQAPVEPLARRQAISAAREAMISAYAPDNGAGYKRYLASQLDVAFAATTLDAADPLVQVNAALAVARVRQVEAVAAVERMLKHRNPAVRYHGVRVYAAIRDALLSQNPDVRDRAVTGVLDLAAREESPVVLGVLYEAMDLSGAAAMPAMVANQLRPRVRAAVVGCLRRCLPGVRAGNAGLAEAVIRGARTAAGLAADRNERTEVLQLLADVMKNAALTYVDLSTEAAAARDRKREAIDARVQSYAASLVELERVIAQITGRSETGVADALRQRPVTPSAVLLAVNEWVGTPEAPGRLAAEGVQPPATLPGPAPATAPAEPSAPPPATAPAPPVSRTPPPAVLPVRPTTPPAAPVPPR